MVEATTRKSAIDVVSGRQSGVDASLWKTIFSDPEFVWVAVIYGIGVSLLTLAMPISVQVLIGAVANTAVFRSLIILAVILFVLLSISGLMVAMQTYVLELFQRRFYGRMTTEFALRSIYSDTAYFERINREQLINYYFEIDIIQKSLPSLLSNGLALILQTLVGYVVVSFYHPVFLFFSVVHALLVYLIWRQADGGAVRTVIQLSKAKHEMANWLESLARNHRLFKSRRGATYAVRRTDEFASRYMARHKKHFGYFFSQHIGFLVLYAVGSALVLGIAGWLVIEGQLSLGQLVAAELILGAIFVGLSRFSYYLELYYGIRASVDKLSRVFDVPLERVPGDDQISEWVPEVEFKKVNANSRGRIYELDAHFPAGSQTLVAPENAGIAIVMSDLIEGMKSPSSGRIILDGHDIQDFDAHHLRDEVAMVYDPQIFETSIADFLKIGDPQISRAQMRELLDVVGLKSVIDELPEGLDTQINDSGLPLSPSEILRIKIARALASRPKILVLMPACDVLRPERRRRIVDYVETMPGTTLIVVSNRRDLDRFDRYMLLGNGYCEVYDQLSQLVTAERSRGGPNARNLDAEP